MDEKRITELIKQLAAPEVEQRRLAAELLGRSRHYRALIPLQNSLADPDPQVRYRAAKGLVWHAGVPKGIRLMTHSDPEVRQGAVWAVDELRRTEDTSALIQALIQALQDSEGGVRAAATYVLGHLGGTDAVEPIIAVLNDPHHLTQMNAADALGKLGDKRAVEPLLKQLQAVEAPRYLIVEALGKLKDDQAIPHLRELIFDDDTFVQEAAVQALIQLEGPRTALQFLFSEQVPIRDTSAMWLSIQSEDTLHPYVPQLLAILEYPPTDLCMPLIRVLAQARDPRALPRLELFLRHPQVELRLAALHALQRLANPTALLSVLLATKDNDAKVRELARQVLEGLEQIRLQKKGTYGQRSRYQSNG